MKISERGKRGVGDCDRIRYLRIHVYLCTSPEDADDVMKRADCGIFVTETVRTDFRGCPLQILEIHLPRFGALPQKGAKSTIIVVCPNRNDSNV